MERQPKPEPAPPSAEVAIRIFVKWEFFLSLLGLILCITFGVLGAVGWAGDWTAIWSPVSLLVGLLLHLIFMGYRLITYMTALIFEVAPAMRNMTQALSALFQGRTTD